MLIYCQPLSTSEHRQREVIRMSVQNYFKGFEIVFSGSEQYFKGFEIVFSVADLILGMASFRKIVKYRVQIVDNREKSVTFVCHFTKLYLTKESNCYEKEEGHKSL